MTMLIADYRVTGNLEKLDWNPGISWLGGAWSCRELLCGGEFGKICKCCG